MMNVRSRSVALMISLAIGATSSAQSSAAPSDFQPFVLSLAPDELVTLQHYVAPYRGYYCTLAVHFDGRIEGWREVPNWARQSIATATLDPAALATLTSAVTHLADGPSVPPPTHGPYLGITRRLAGGAIRQSTFAAIRSEDARRIATLIEHAWLSANPTLDHGCGPL